MSVDRIAAQFNLAVDAVKEAIASGQSTPPKIAQDFEREERLVEASGMNDPHCKDGGKFKVVPPEEVARILRS